MVDNHNTISNDSHTEQPSTPMETAVVTAAAAKTTTTAAAKTTTTTTTSRKQVSYGQTQSMPVRLPSSYPHYSPTTPQQRWRLLKTVRRAQTAMTRSLQVEERELLHHMTKNTSATMTTTMTTTMMTLDPQTFLCPTTTTTNNTTAAAAASLSTSTLPSSLPEVAQEAKDGDDHNDDEPDVKDDPKNTAHHQVAADDDDENDAKVAAAAAESESEYYDCPNRQELWQVLEEDQKKIKSQRSSFFTPKEHDYLRQLIQTPKIPSDYVAKARQSVVLSIQRQQALLLALQQEYGDDDNDHDDNDHDDDNHDEGEHEAGLEVDYKHHTDQEDHPPPSTQTTKGSLPETKAPIRKSLFRASVAAKGNTKQPTSQLLQQQQQQQALPARDASFRQELWSWSSRSLASPKKGGQPQQPQEQPQEPLEADSTTTFSSPTPILSSLFSFFMGGGSSNSNNNNNANKAEEATVDTTTDDLNDNNDNEFDDWDDTIVLGTTTGGHDPECQPHVLTPPLMYALRPHLPLSLRCDHYWLKYSLVRDGASMRTLVRHIRSSARTLLAVETTTGHVLGCFCSAPWTPHGSGFFGSGEAFCWKLAQSRYTRGSTTLEEQVALEQDVRVFSWSGQNRNVQRLVKEYSELMVGGGRPDDDLLDPTKFMTTTTTTATTNAPRTKSMILRDKYGSALVLSPDLERGYSHPCVTFQSPRLCCDSCRSNDQEVTKKGDGGEEVSCAGTATEPPFTTTTTTTSTTTSQPPVKNNNNEDEGNENFNILNVEVWTWTPMDTVEEAEKVELGRRFIFDNGAFLES